MLTAWKGLDHPESRRTERSAIPSIASVRCPDVSPELPARDHTDVVTVRNDLRTSVVLAIEPTGDVYWLDPGKSVVVTVVGPAGGALEVVRLPGRIEVFLWVGATGQLREGDTGELVDDFPIPFPLTPREPPSWTSYTP
jgi:hypothetical protein